MARGYDLLSFVVILMHLMLPTCERRQSCLCWYKHEVTLNRLECSASCRLRNWNIQWKFPVLILHVTNIQDFLLKLNCSVCYLMYRECDVTQLRLLWKPSVLVLLTVFQMGEHWHCCKGRLLCFSTEADDREKAVPWSLHESGLTETWKLQFYLQVALVSWVSFWSEVVFKHSSFTV